LFNLANEPFEQHDLSGAHPDRVHHMQAALDNWLDAVEADRRQAQTTTGEQA